MKKLLISVLLVLTVILSTYTTVIAVDDVDPYKNITTVQTAVDDVDPYAPPVNPVP